MNARFATEDAAGAVTRLPADARAGRADARDRIYTLPYRDLHGQARGFLLRKPGRRDAP